MKHKNEDISRLDGDFYEGICGHVFYMPHISAVGPPLYPDRNQVAYSLFTSYGIIEIRFYSSGNHDIYLKEEGKQGYLHSPEYVKDICDLSECYRQQFIEVWKHWKREK